MIKKKDMSVAALFALKFAFFCIILALISAFIIFISVFTLKNETKKSSTKNGFVDADIISGTRTVILDPGHGGEDGGASGKNGALEKELNLEIAFILRDMLSAAGINVVMTRDTDILLYDRNADYMGHKKSLDLKARLEIAKSTPDSVFVSIHMNSFPNPKYSGLQVWYSPGCADSKLLAAKLQENVKNNLQPQNNRAIKQANSSIYLLDRAVSTAVLVECGFLSNENEAALLSEESYRQKLAFVIFASIMEHLEK
ncbi:MAG: N-acetylmuramoyl-L-alanine amidase [Clostridia bacterium]|nr:N-acetylmuramoyl-L-alanine amidase [Clostridia bacterium]